MAGSLAERLQLIVEATDSGADATFRRLSGTMRDADSAARSTGQSIAASADRVATARLKEQDAADRVTLAERRLEELRERGVGGSRLLDAEQKVEQARRRLHLATRDVTESTEAHTRAERDAKQQLEKSAEATERQSRGLGDLAAKAGGLVAGISVGDWARDAVLGFVDGARASQAMATSMNATVAQAGAFLGLVGSVGLELDDLIEIQAEFAGKTKDGLTQLGTELSKNADGTVNWTETLVDTLAELQKIPDATERNRLGFSMFGEEGYKQLSRLLNSGVDVREAIDRIGTPFTDEDVELSRQFDAAMLELRTTSGDLGRTLGREVVPVLVGLIDAGQTVASVVTAIPAPIAAATLAAVLLGRGIISTAGAADLAAGAIARASGVLAAYRINALVAGSASAAVSAGMAATAAAGAGVSRLVGLLGGPLGIALIGAGTAFMFASKGSDALTENARDAAVELSKVEGNATKVGMALSLGANNLEENAGYWERSAAYVRGYQEDLSGVELAAAKVIAPFQRLTMGFGDTADTAQGFELAISEAEAELGKFGAQQAVAQIATKTLNDLIAEGATGGQAFTDAVRAAADAQASEARTSDLAKAALDAYTATTRDAVQTTLDLYSAQLSQQQGVIGVQQAWYDTAQTVDDAKTPWNELDAAVLDAIETTISYAGTAADAAVEAARAAGTVLDPLSEAKIRADATIAALRESLNDPNLTAGGREQLEGLIAQLEDAKGRGDIEAVLRLTGAGEVAGELDATTEDRETTISVASRGGPAVVEYLDRITGATRLALVRVESRGGPDVAEYLRGLADAQRLAIIRTETRGGPAVGVYLDGLAHERLAIIRVETRGGPDVDRYLDSLAATRTAVIDARRGAGLPATGAGTPLLRGSPGLAAAEGARFALGSVTLDLELTGRMDRGQLSAAQRGRAVVADVRAYERENGTGWRKQ